MGVRQAESTDQLKQSILKMSVKVALLFLFMAGVVLSVRSSAIQEKTKKEFDYDYYNPAALWYQKKSMDYDYYNPYYLQYQKRGSICLPFGMSCSTKGIPCCNKNVECRCNLFNTNCKCQRASLFG